MGRGLVLWLPVFLQSPCRYHQALTSRLYYTSKMSRCWPHTEYIEDQPLSHTILYTHVLTRGIQAGAVVGTGVGTTLFLLRHYRILTPKFPSSTLTATLLRSVGVGTVLGLAFLFAVPIRMMSREEYEWQDRSWRLMENKGQLECDHWTYVGMTAGLLGGVGSREAGLGWRGMVGSVGLGSVVGMMGYLGWRHGVKGGKFEEEGEV